MPSTSSSRKTPFLFPPSFPSPPQCSSSKTTSSHRSRSRDKSSHPLSSTHRLTMCVFPHPVGPSMKQKGESDDSLRKRRRETLPFQFPPALRSERRLSC